MTINTTEFNSKPGEIILIDDIDVEREILQYIHTEQESKLKERIWMQQNAEYLKKQKELKRERKRDLKSDTKKRPRQFAITTKSQIGPISESCVTPNVKGELDDTYSEINSQRNITGFNNYEAMSDGPSKKQKKEEKAFKNKSLLLDILRG
tara:strand:+ start:472 stop:924 length:453 start_codon:yes stop_codon:yes gene_type:complete